MFLVVVDLRYRISFNLLHFLSSTTTTGPQIGRKTRKRGDVFEDNDSLTFMLQITNKITLYLRYSRAEKRELCQLSISPNMPWDLQETHKVYYKDVRIQNRNISWAERFEAAQNGAAGRGGTRTDRRSTTWVAT